MTDTIWAIIHIIVAAVAFAVGFRITAKIREWRDNTRNIEREIPFSLFLEAYGKAPDRWTLLPYYVRYGGDDVRFENYADYRKYKKWREKRKRDAEEERKRSMNERLFREIRSDIMPTPPTTGSSSIKPNPNFTPPPTIYKPTKSADLREEIKKYGERDDDVVRVNGAKLFPQPAETCGDCQWTVGNDPEYVTCMNDHRDHLRSERCRYRKQAVLPNPKDGLTNAEIDKIRADLMLTAQAQEKQNNPRCKDCVHMRYKQRINSEKFDTVCVRHITKLGLEHVWPEMTDCGIFEERPKEVRDYAKCGKCRQFDKGDNSPFGYCFRNDEIVDEASAKGCFEPKSKAEERPEPLGTVTTH